MNTVAAILTLAACGLSAGAASAAPSVEVRDAAARMVVIPEARADVDVQVAGGDARLPRPQVRIEGGRVTVDGGLAHRIASCSSNDLNFNGRHKTWKRSVDVRGIGRVDYDQLPVITARVPMNAAIGVGGAVWGEIGPTASLNLAHAGCGDWTVAPVRGALDLATAGSGDTRARTAGRLNSATRGSGDLFMDAVDGPTRVSIAGSGDVRIGRVGGEVADDTAGSGDVVIDRGRASNVAVRIAGSGDFVFRGEAGALSATIAGSGDVHVAHVTGPVSKSVHGSGDVTTGR